MGLGLRAVVEAEDGFDGADEFSGKGDAAFANAVGDSVLGLVDEGDAEGLLHGGDGADEFDGAAFGAGGVGRDGEAVLFGEGADEFDRVGVCAVVLAVLGVGEAIFAGAVGSFERGLASDDDGDGDFVCQMALVVRRRPERRELFRCPAERCAGKRRGEEWIFSSLPWGSPIWG